MNASQISAYKRQCTIHKLEGACIKAAACYRAKYGDMRNAQNFGPSVLYFRAAENIHFIELVPTEGWPHE